ncbi:E3 ubiquitin-protein ligase [Trichostrongylus colubriformis]|uniref:E3 ubiquitin-protein ligase n=1 Tax=Trichostrongylus colubriformis TaxID=6319 RepID=A0AAN8FPF0_TRICO
MMQDDDDEECPVCAQKMILPTSVPGCGHKFCFLCIKGAAFRTEERLCPMCRGTVNPSIFRSPAMRGVTLDMHDPESPTVAAGPSRAKSDSPGPLSKRARVSNDQAGPSRSETREKPNEQESVLSQKQQEPCGTPCDERYYWLYEGRGGWWRFDPRLEKDLENGRRSEQDTVELIICGFTYSVDFEQMVQYRKDRPARTRSIKRVSEKKFQEMSNGGLLKGISGVRVTQK